MRLAIRHVCVAICLAMLAGCAPPPQAVLQPRALQGPAGRNFPQSAFAGFALDQTTPAEVQAALGPPLKQSTTSAIAKPDSKVIAPGTRFSITHFFYFYAPNGPGLPATEHPNKIAVVFFFDGRLFLYGFGSTLPGEASPPIDEQLLASLRQGKTTRAQAVALLGQPNSEGLHLLDNQKGSTQISYAWSSNQSGTVKLRTLNVFFDRSGRMSTYTLQDNTYPANTAPLQLPGSPKAPPAVPGDRIPPVPQYDLDHT